MKTLAEISFEYIWLLLFSDEDIMDLDYAASLQQSLPEYFASMNSEEKSALSLVAKETKSRLLAAPDKDGYTARTLVTDDQILFLDALSSGELYEQWS